MPASIKPINLIQKYAHIIDTYACILKILATTIDLTINILISFGNVQLQNYQNKYHYSIHIKQSNEFQYQNTHQSLLHILHPSFYLVEYL